VANRHAAQAPHHPSRREKARKHHPPPAIRALFASGFSLGRRHGFRRFESYSVQTVDASKEDDKKHVNNR
jgi:hypothetical protein